MGELRHRLGKLLMRLGVEGIPNRAALCEASRELRRALTSDRVPEWLAAELVSESSRSAILRQVEPPTVFWSTFVGQVRGVFRKHRADVLPAEARIHGTEIFHLVGPRPNALANRIRKELPTTVRTVRAEDAFHRSADERLLALPAPIAIDAIPTVLELGERVPLTGIVVTGLQEAQDAALLVLGPATGVPVQWTAPREDGADAVLTTPDSALRTLLGPELVRARPGRLSPFWTISAGVPTPLHHLHRLFHRLIQEGELRRALSTMNVVRAERSGWTLERLEEEVRTTCGILSAMTDRERRRPQDIDPARLRVIARAADVPPTAVQRLIGDYLDRLRSGPRGDRRSAGE